MRENEYNSVIGDIRAFCPFMHGLSKKNKKPLYEDAEQLDKALWKGR